MALVVDALRATGLDEIDVAEQDGDPRQETKDANEVDEVTENLGRRGRGVHVGQAADRGGDAEGIVWDAALVGLCDEFRGVLLQGQTVESAGGDVEIGICSAEDEDEDAAVEKAGENIDAGELDCGDELRMLAA